MPPIIISQKGFVALISAVIVSAILLAMAASAACASFWARFDILARENQKIAQAQAQACVDLAMRGIAKNEIVTAWSECEIVGIEDKGGGVWEINVRANWKNSYANLKVAIEKSANGRIAITNREEF